MCDPSKERNRASPREVVFRLPYARSFWHAIVFDRISRQCCAHIAQIHEITDDRSVVFIVQMLRFCRAVHSASVLHMDIKPDNWLLTRRPGSETDCAESFSQSLSLIDFGRAIDLSVFPQQGSRTAFKGQCCASSFACPAMAEVRSPLVVGGFP